MFEPFLERAIEFLKPVGQAYGIEGEVITPETAARLAADYDLRVVFLVRSSAADIADSKGPNPWLAAASTELVSSVIAEVLAWSTYVQSACRRLSFPCFDVAGDFERAMANAASSLIEGATPT